MVLGSHPYLPLAALEKAVVDLGSRATVQVFANPDKLLLFFWFWHNFSPSDCTAVTLFLVGGLQVRVTGSL
jgi:hypothetical protein